MTDSYSKSLKKEALLMTETIAVMDHLLTTYGWQFSDADFSVIREALNVLHEQAERIAQERRHSEPTL